jgi:hypothetical protein
MFGTMITENEWSGAGMYDTDHRKQGGRRRNVQYIFTENWPLDENLFAPPAGGADTKFGLIAPCTPRFCIFGSKCMVPNRPFTDHRIWGLPVSNV